MQVSYWVLPRGERAACSPGKCIRICIPQLRPQLVDALEQLDVTIGGFLWRFGFHFYTLLGIIFISQPGAQCQHLLDMFVLVQVSIIGDVVDQRVLL